MKSQPVITLDALDELIEPGLMGVYFTSGPIFSRGTVVVLQVTNRVKMRWVTANRSHLNDTTFWGYPQNLVLVNTLRKV